MEFLKQFPEELFGNISEGRNSCRNPKKKFLEESSNVDPGEIHSRQEFMRKFPYDIPGVIPRWKFCKGSQTDLLELFTDAIAGGNSKTPTEM